MNPRCGRPYPSLYYGVYNILVSLYVSREDRAQVRVVFGKTNGRGAVLSVGIIRINIYLNVKKGFLLFGLQKKPMLSAEQRISI